MMTTASELNIFKAETFIVWKQCERRQDEQAQNKTGCMEGQHNGKDKGKILNQH